MSDIDELIARIRASTDPFDRDLDMAIAKRMGVVPQDAEWGGGVEISDFVADSEKFMGKWTTPAHKEYRKKFLALYEGAGPAKADIEVFDEANPWQHNWNGRLPYFHSLLDAARSLIPAKYRLWKCGVSDEGPWAHIACGYAPEENIIVKGAPDVPSAFCIAALLTLDPDNPRR